MSIASLRPVLVWAIISLMICTLSSCISTLPVTKTYPAEIDLNEFQSKVLLVSCYDPRVVTYDNENRKRLCLSGTENLKNALLESFQDNPDFTLSSLPSTLRKTANKKFGTTLPPDSVSLLCSINHVPLLLCLDAYHVQFEKRMNYEGEENMADFYLIVRAGISLYDSTGDVIDRSYLSLEEFTDSRNTLGLQLAFRPSYSGQNELVDRLSYDIGWSYLDKFYLQSVSKEVLYFKNKHFSHITPFLKSGEWQKAIELFLPLADENAGKIRNRAAYNLGLLYEISGDMEKSVYWFNQSNLRLY